MGVHLTCPINVLSIRVFVLYYVIHCMCLCMTLISYFGVLFEHKEMRFVAAV